LNQVCKMNGMRSLFIEEVARRMWSIRVHGMWSFIAWACMIMHKAQKQCQMNSEHQPNEIGRVTCKAIAYVPRFQVNSSFVPKHSSLRKSQWKNPNMIMWVMVGKVLM
jgi:hypothetical protein